MTEREARNKLTHAALWLRSEGEVKPAWAAPGVYFALREISKARETFFCNRPHINRRCKRCAEIVAVAQMIREVR